MIQSHVRSGKIESKRVDIKETNIEKEKFEKYINFFRNILMNVSISIKTLEELTKESEENKIFNNYCPSFLRALFHNFWGQSVIELNECFNGDFSFRNFLNYIEANWNKIYTGKWIDTTNWNDGTIDTEEIKYNRKTIIENIRKDKELLEKHINLIAKIKTFRDKVFAHIDEDYPEEILKLKELREIFIVAEELFNRMSGMYDRIHRCLEPTNSGDIRNVVKCVETYDKYKELIQETRRKEIEAEFNKIFNN
jgi:hypothetical protein